MYEGEMGILRRTGRSTVRAMCGAQLKVRNRATDLMLGMGLNETVDQLAIMANGVHWDSHVWRKVLQLEADGQWKKGRLMRK